MRDVQTRSRKLKFVRRCLVGAGSVFALGAAGAAAQPSDAPVDEIVVIGTPGGAGANRQAASFAVTTINPDEITKFSPQSTADLFKAIPGVWAESSGGVAGANIDVRGLPGGGDAPFVLLAINGSPIYGTEMLSFFEQSSIFRIDETIAGVEGLRGGPNSVFGKGEPGLTVNFNLKEGGEETEGRIKYSTSDYGLQRVDDRGRTWRRHRPFPVEGQGSQPGSPAHAGLAFVILDPVSGEPGTPTRTLFVGVADTVGQGLYRSDDAGATWTRVEGAPPGLSPVKAALDQVMLAGTPEEQVAAGEAARSLLSLWDDDERTRASVYSTARTVVWPWAEPGMANSSRGTSVDLDWLLAGANSLYLCAPIEDQVRLAPAFGGFLNDIIKQAYLRVAQTGRPLDPPLLVVIDEAGNTPLRSMPEYASTLAGLGVLLVTVWQSLAQIESTYGRQTGTILSYHLSKLFYAGLSDPDSMRYVAGVLGDEEVETLSRTDDLHGGRGSRQIGTSRSPLAAPHVLRQMLPGDALLVHGTLPPAHVRTRPYYRERTLRRRAEIPVPESDAQPASTVAEVTVDATTD